ncbi:jasmonate-induced protein homolog [Silene latifolia]|uniref:jasmonate-induced protein homolog n=1 Tax=Silene latifolia TaxID=37657 RepID=UPI003D780EC5
MATMQVQKGILSHPQNGTQATMNNNTHREMTLGRSHSWAGRPVYPFPETVYPNFSANFSHSKDNLLGSKGVVVYNGRSATGLNCSWVLAWHAPINNTPPLPPNRVYVVCGPKNIIDKMSLDQIQEDLDKAYTSETFTDQATKTSVDGVIHDLVPDQATLVGDFNLVP